MRVVVVLLSLCALATAYYGEIECGEHCVQNDMYRGNGKFTVEDHKVEFGYEIYVDRIRYNGFFIECGGWPALESKWMPRFKEIYNASSVLLLNCPLPDGASIASKLASYNVALVPENNVLKLTLLNITSKPALSAHHLQGFESLTSLSILVKPTEYMEPKAGALSNLNKLSILLVDGAKLPPQELRGLTSLEWFQYTKTTVSPLHDVLHKITAAVPTLRILKLSEGPVRNFEIDFEDKQDIETGKDRQLLGLEELSVTKLTEKKLLPFENCEALKVIDFYDFNGEELPEQWLSACPRLEELSIWDASNLKQLPGNILDGTFELKSLVLTQCPLTTLPDGLLKDARNLEKVTLICGNLRTLSSDLFESAAGSLRDINISSNQLDVSALAAFKNLNSLKELYISSNRLEGNVCEDEVTIPVLNFGMLMGWQSPMTPILQDPGGPAPEPISDETISWMASVTFFPPILCGCLVGDLADRWGRKITTLLTSLCLVVSWVIIMLSLAPWALITSRVVAGLACAGCYVVTPLYLKEIAADNIRGALGSLFILVQNFGYIVVYVAGDMLSFAAVMWLCTAVPVVHFFAFLAMPETPVFLVKQGKIKEARSALAWLRNKSTDNKDIEEAIKQLEREEDEARSMEKASWKSIIKDKTTFKAFRISLNVMLSQETCGYLVVLMYAGSIFEQASESIHLKLSPNKQTIVVGSIQMLGSIVASCIVESTGRKWLLASTSFVTGLSMLALGGWFYLTSGGVWLPGWLPVVAMCLCIFADAAGYQPVPYVITSELFSFQHRGMVTSFVSSVDALSDFLQTKAYDPLLKLLGIHWVFIMFSVVCFLGTAYTVLWVPETKDRTVEEIYAILRDGRKKEKRKDVEVGREVSRL